MKRRRRTLHVPLDQLLAAAPQLRIHHDLSLSWGLQLTRAQLWRCRDGSCTARLVWRGMRDGITFATDSVARGLRL